MSRERPTQAEELQCMVQAHHPDDRYSSDPCDAVNAVISSHTCVDIPEFGGMTIKLSANQIAKEELVEGISGVCASCPTVKRLEKERSGRTQLLPCQQIMTTYDPGRVFEQEY